MKRLFKLDGHQPHSDRSFHDGGIRASSIRRPPISAACATPVCGPAKRRRDLVTDEAGNIVGANLVASGTATYLGFWAGKGDLRFTPDPVNPTLLHADGEEVFIADNGDQLRTVFRDAVLDVTTGLGTGTALFAGGTGRFTTATGSAAFVAEQNAINGAFHTTIVGSISFGNIIF